MLIIKQFRTLKLEAINIKKFYFFELLFIFTAEKTKRD